MHRRGVTYFNELSILIGLLVGLVVGIRHLVKSGDVILSLALFLITSIVSTIVVWVTLMAFGGLSCLIPWLYERFRGTYSKDTEIDQD